MWFKFRIYRTYKCVFIITFYLFASFVVSAKLEDNCCVKNIYNKDNYNMVL